MGANRRRAKIAVADRPQRESGDDRGRPASWPDIVEVTPIRHTRIVLAAAHLDHDPSNNRPGNLRSLCQRCHLTRVPIR